jgi:hypothetical protein
MVSDKAGTGWRAPPRRDRVERPKRDKGPLSSARGIEAARQTRKVAVD